MTRIFINGKEVKKEDLEKIEIKCEALNRIIAHKCTKEAEKAS